MSGASHFRGHLFADLRGSTAFTERAGNAAGAELVRSFRQMIRDEVGQHEGAVVKTEGDAVYVVFPSASTAVMCGLALIDRAAAATAENPEMPMHVGIGVHAGEAIEVPEGGYIGTAVNLAARVCAAAEAGEVLVTSTVRGITQASIPVTFASRGRRRLKGISEPVELYRVVPQGVVVRSPRRVSRAAVAAAAASFGVIVVAAVALAIVVAPTPPTATATPFVPQSVAPRATPNTPAIGALAIGEYVTSLFQPPFNFAVVDPNWSFTGEEGGSASFLYQGEPGGTVDVGRTTTVYSNACGGGEPVPLITTPQELMTSLAGLEYLTIGAPRPVVINGKTGLTADATVNQGAYAACSGPTGGGVAVFPIGRKEFTVEPGGEFRITALDVGGGNVAAIGFRSGLGPGAPVTQLETFYAVAQRLANSIRFQSQ